MGPGRLVVRWLDARFELQTSDALESPLRDHPLAGDRLAYHAEPEHLHRRQRQDGAQDQGLDVPAAVAVEDPVEQEGVQEISAATANAQATIVNTRSGS